MKFQGIQVLLKCSEEVAHFPQSMALLKRSNSHAFFRAFGKSRLASRSPVSLNEPESAEIQSPWRVSLLSGLLRSTVTLFVSLAFRSTQ